MSIPKIIHYCWFGNNEKPELAIKCIKSWQRFCPDYKIIEWNEENFDLSICPIYVKQAYKEKKWAFVTDYVRLKVVYDHGGIYMDTDVELKRNLNKYLNRKAFFAFENGIHIATGLGFGAEQGCQILHEMMNDYKDIPFRRVDGTYDLTPCPKRNTKVLLKHGLKQDDSMQVIEDNILILPTIYMCPISYETGKHRKSFKTISIHWFAASWKDAKEEAERKLQIKRLEKERRRHYIVHLPNLVLLKLLGNDLYEKMKAIIKKYKIS